MSALFKAASSFNVKYQWYTSQNQWGKSLNLNESTKHPNTQNSLEQNE